MITLLTVCDILMRLYITIEGEYGIYSQNMGYMLRIWVKYQMRSQ
jgi:hypothetical protein